MCLEIRSSGSQALVLTHLRPLRAACHAPPPAPTAPEAHTVTRWILTRPDRLDADDAAELEKILDRSPQLAATAAHVAAFAQMLCERHGDQLDAPIATVEANDQPDLHRFTYGLGDGDTRTYGILPTQEQLKAALLQASELGPPFAVKTTTGSSATFSGCPELAGLLNESSAPQQVHQDVTFSGGDLGPFVAEALTTAPSPALAAADTQVRSALAACRSLTVTTTSGTVLTFALSPITFGGPNSTAVRMDAELRGVQVNGYVGVERIDEVELVYVFFQVGSGSSQLASHYYREAVGKVRRVL